AMAALDSSVLIERLRGESVGQRALVLRMAARYPSTIERQILLEQAASAIQGEKDPAFSAALEVLAVISDEDSLRRLVNRFPSLPIGVRRKAAVVLSEMTLRHADVARSCIDAGPFDGEGWLAVTVMLAALARGGQPTSQRDMELLTRCLLADNASVRCAALDALSAFGDAAAADAIAFSLADEELEVRMAAVRALGRLRGEGESASVIGRLIDLAQRTDDHQLLVVAVQAIGETSDPRVLSVLRPLVRSSEPSVAVAAVEAIGLVNDARRVEALMDALSHQDVEVVKAAMGSLARETDVRVEVHLGACLDHDAWDVRRLAADLLGQRGGDVALGMLRAKHGSEREPLVKEALERALAAGDGNLPTRRSSAAPRQGSWRPR
ncbi:MAG TPA: HEAT repeat domain-containing protein, partial [Polyangiaceae bacterium]